MPYTAAPARYDAMEYRRCGRSGLKLSAVSLGYWHNFGGTASLENARALTRRAFDLGGALLRLCGLCRGRLRHGGGLDLGLVGDFVFHADHRG